MPLIPLDIHRYHSNQIRLSGRRHISLLKFLYTYSRAAHYYMLLKQRYTGSLKHVANQTLVNRSSINMTLDIGNWMAEGHEKLYSSLFIPTSHFILQLRIVVGYPMERRVAITSNLGVSRLKSNSLEQRRLYQFVWKRPKKRNLFSVYYTCWGHLYE